METTIMRFIDGSHHFSNYNHTRCTIECQDLITREYIRLIFLKRSKLFSKVCNIKFHGAFTEVITYDYIRRNNVRVALPKYQEEFKEKYPEAFI
jgi:hypothetical protein